MKQLNLRSIVVKKYRPQRSNKTIISKENLLNQDFSTETICEKWLVLLIFNHGFTHEKNCKLYIFKPNDCGLCYSNIE